MYQQNAYVVAYENAPDLECTVIDAAENGIFLRNYKGLLIVGGGSHRTGKNGGGFNVPREFAKRYFPDAKEKYAWINQDCISLDGVPYIGQYGKLLPNVYTATGFNLWGMTTSMAAAEILADMTAGRYNRYAPVFYPSRKNEGKQSSVKHRDLRTEFNFSHCEAVSASRMCVKMEFS